MSRNSNPTCFTQNIENAKTLANKFNDVNVNQYGPAYKNYLTTGQGDIDSIQSYNDQMINMTNDLNTAIINTNQNIINSQQKINEQDSQINNNLAKLAQVENETNFINKQAITTDKIIANTLQKNIFAKHMYSVLIVLNIILFVVVLGLFKK